MQGETICTSCATWGHGFFSFLFLQLISVSHLFFLLKITLRSLFYLPSFSSPPFVTFKLLASFGGGNERDLRWMIPNACQSIFPKFLIFMQFWAYILPNNWLAHSVWSWRFPLENPQFATDDMSKTFWKQCQILWIFHHSLFLHNSTSASQSVSLTQWM